MVIHRFIGPYAESLMSELMYLVIYLLQKLRSFDLPCVNQEIYILYFRHCQPTVDYLKMDVEGSEVDAIEAMYSEGVLDRIKQLGLEV